MTIKSFVTILIGFMFCFCLFSKQGLQSPKVSFDAPISHQLDYDETDFDVRDIVSANDDSMLLPVVISFSILFVLLPAFFRRHYKSPFISTPKRPPSI
ncbi:MAG: hypothetical protein RJB18_432 [Pseudomonadota bacterium]|jgi:hypothetical protein